ncbi:hypothetical protein [Burkholderia pseudomallei]|uniref:hypothetical protein n=1 Tax=Burkholderia pseudomallei TaxID=28450 RepID=UPI0019D39327|nr:hypothetical protein [Burkholderia pseudomallei]
MQTDLLSALKAAHLAAYRRDDHEQMNVAARDQLRGVRRARARAAAGRAARLDRGRGLT